VLSISLVLLAIIALAVILIHVAGLASAIGSAVAVGEPV